MKTMNQCFERVLGASFSVMIAGFVLSFVLTTCKSNDDDLPTEEPTGLAAVKGRFDSERLVSLAVCRVVDGKSKSVKAAEEQPLVIRYAFDFVKISDATHYVAKGVNFPLLNEVCGKGEIDVFLTTFETYEYADETKDMECRRPVVNDDLIVFRGELGMYACMMNSGWLEMTEYSSHKRFSGNAVEKDFTPPLYQFYVKTENNVTSLACRNSNEFGSLPGQSSLQWTKLQGGNIVSSQNLFSTEELTVMPEISQECTITEIGEDYLMVSGKSNLQKIFFDDYTLFVAGGKPAKLTDFAKGDVVTVTFDKLYEKYDPKVALANKIAKK